MTAALLASAIRHSLGSIDSRLPSVRELAGLHHASTRTVELALEILETEGRIERHSRSGVWKTGTRFPTNVTKPRSSPGAIAEQLSREIAEGRHPHTTPLPGTKILASLFGCHAQTVSKALARLVAEGELRREGRSHFPSLPVPGRNSPSRILVVGAGDDQGRFRMDSDREWDFWRDLGLEAAAAGIELHRQAWTGAKLEIDPSILGVVSSTWHLTEIQALLSNLSRSRLPVCVWIQDQRPAHELVRSFPRIRFHDQGYGPEAGRSIGEHLERLGHRTVAFISPWHGAEWSRNREVGLRKAFTSGSAVHAFCMDGRSEWDYLEPAWSDEILWEGFPREVLERITEGSPEPLLHQAIRDLGFNRIRRALDPMFQGAMRCGATAWVCANDSVALDAIEWMERHPGGNRNVSVCGFDDTVAALRGNLTSYRFDSASMARSMIRQILTNRSEPTLVSHRGFVVARASSRVAARKGRAGEVPSS